MSKKDENKSRKRLTLSLGLIISLGVLSVVYAIVSSQLNIKSDRSELVNNRQGLVQFSSDANDAFAFSIGNELTMSGVDSGPFYSTDHTLKDDKTSPSYVFANAGTVSIEKNINDNDTAKIEGTQLFDRGTYVVYKLKVKNTSDSLPMRLSEINNDGITSNPEGIKDYVKVKIYDADPNVSGSAGSEIQTISREAAGSLSSNKSNYLLPNGTTDWYVKVSCDPAASSFTNGTFSFQIRPVWVPYQK